MAKPIEATKSLKGADAMRLIESLKTCATPDVMADRRLEASSHLARVIVKSSVVR